MKLLALGLFAYLGLSGQGLQPVAAGTAVTVQADISHPTEPFPSSGHLRGVRTEESTQAHHNRVDGMMRERVRLATIEIDFDWNHEGQQLKDWRVVRQMYFRDYGGSDQIDDPEQLERIRASGLETELQKAALEQAKRAHWVERPRARHGLGYTIVDFADDEQVPVSLPVLGRIEADLTPLMRAAMLGDNVGIKRLLGEGADVNAANRRGLTALTCAASSNNPAALDSLLKAGARVNANPKGGGTALLTAVANMKPKNVEILLRAGADANVRNAEGETAVSVATRGLYQYSFITQASRGPPVI